jgi:hypothetical protein
MDKSLHVTGILIYRHQRNSTEVLLVNDSFNHKRHWTAPKGRVIGDEDELKYVGYPGPITAYDDLPRWHALNTTCGNNIRSDQFMLDTISMTRKLILIGFCC